MQDSEYTKNKVANFNNYTLSAYQLFHECKYDKMANDFRKACEAFMKIILVLEVGEDLGKQIIAGRKTIDGSTVENRKSNLFLKELLDVAVEISNPTFWKEAYLSPINKIRTIGNDNSHDNDAGENLGLAEAEQCKETFGKVIQILYKNILSIDIPPILVKAKESQIYEDKFGNLEWEHIFDSCQRFSLDNKYILISDSYPESISQMELYALTNINWSFILDFDKSSQRNGLFRAFSQKYKNEIIPLTLEQKKQLNLISNGRHTLNWLFASGVASIPRIIPADYKDWRQRYSIFIQNALNEFFDKETNRCVFVYLLDDKKYLRELIRIVSTLTEQQSDLFTHVLLSENNLDEFCDEIRDEYDIDIFYYKCSKSQFCHKSYTLASSIKPDEESAILIPVRNNEEENFIDISQEYARYLDAGIEIIHKEIYNKDTKEDNSLIPAFYRGNMIAWSEINSGYHIERNVYNELIDRVKNLLTTTKYAIRFDFKHLPGAGGSTLARLCAYNMRCNYPTVILEKYTASTIKQLIKLSEQSQKTILAIVESSKIKQNELEAIRERLSQDRKPIVFVYVNRVLENIKIQDPKRSILLKNTIYGQDEKERFIDRLKIYAKNPEKYVNELQTKYFSDCDILDFVVSLDEDLYNNNQLIAYTNSYTENMSIAQKDFLIFTCLVYKYIQRGLPDILVRDIFEKKMALAQLLKSTSVQQQHIRRFLNQYKGENGEIEDIWRPRFSKFADIVLKALLGDGNDNDDWKDQLYIYSERFIEVFHRNNPYENRDVKDILFSLFLSRNNSDDILSIDDYTEEFSPLLIDIAVYEQQRSIFEKLISCYDRNPHLYGHFARFLYENAQDEGMFQEAESYIEKAFECGSENDFNLQHLAGMCKKRQIEYLHKKYRKESIKSVNEIEVILQSLTDEANLHFEKSRGLHAQNVYAYIAQLQTILDVVKFGKELHNIECNDMLANNEYKWYANVLSKSLGIIDQTQVIIEQKESLGMTNKLLKSKNLIKACEADFWRLMGKLNKSKDIYEHLVNTGSRSLRGFYRNLYINSLLLEKTNGNSQRINDGWKLLNLEERERVNNYLKKSIAENPNNTYNFRLWLNYHRYSQEYSDIEDIIPKIIMWKKASEENNIYNLESSYYLYILYSTLSIKRGEDFDSQNVTMAKQYIEECKTKSSTPKSTFEWLGEENGIAGIINHRYKDNHKLFRTSGTVSQIISRQQGWIEMKCGLKLFFVPYLAKLEQGRDEMKEVSFYVGFRHDGLSAWDVVLITINDSYEQVYHEGYNTFFDEFVEDVCVEPVEAIEVIEDLIDENKTALTNSGEDEIYKIDGNSLGIKIVDKIDLSKIPKR
ncbi:hypothetical protein [Bacteroides thetaiotaomicron]|jgi:negative regulator of genetic competence, sporulation and motility|uniref:hypothetical protein n=1 Tax=Bacteroides thetaiotaomicron TaxID=818 RepID=UPI000E53C76B|nr:hypothetical protein [Bacteroides thetaiotaomicron]RHI40131.1 hypothetical protein DW167_19920 [Bacteroides thetaiotaomicron]